MTPFRLTAPRAFVALALLAAFAPAFSPAAHAQNDALPSTTAAAKPAPELTQTIFLNNATGQRDLNDITTDLRNMLRTAHIYAVVSQSAITIRGSAEDQALAQTLVNQLDRPRKVYRLTYTLTDSEDARSAGAQHVSLIAVTGTKSMLKQGARIPIVTAGADNDAKSQVQYVDIGLNIEATITGSSDAPHLETTIEQSSLGDEKPAAVMQDPVIHQTKLEGAADLALNKPLVLGSLDLPDSTHHLQVEVVAETVR